MKLLKSRTWPVCNDCMRLWAAPLIRDLSGVSIRFTALFAASGPSRPLSVRAACADCIAVEVFGREATLGDEGFNGSGGGALSGSELSHLAVMVSDV